MMHITINSTTIRIVNKKSIKKKMIVAFHYERIHVLYKNVHWLLQHTAVIALDYTLIEYIIHKKEIKILKSTFNAVCITTAVA